MISLAFALNKVSAHGDKYSTYEKDSQEVIAGLLQLREQKVVDYLLECDLIEILSQIESKKNSDYGDVTIKLANDGLKAMIPGGAVAKAACDVVSSTVRRYARKEQQGLPQDIADSVADVTQNTVKKEIFKSALDGASELASNIAGAGAVAAAVANAPFVAAAAGLALVSHPTLANKCWYWLSNTVKGTVAIAKESTKIFQNDTNKLIIESHSFYNKKRVKLIDKEKAKLSKEAEKIKAGDRLKSYELQLANAKEKLENHFTYWFGRFVFYVNQPTGFFSYLTSLLSALSTRFEEEKAAQDKIALTMLEIKQLIHKEGSLVKKLSQEINDLATKFLNMTHVVAELEQNYLGTLAS